jgi:hypothetical protein
VTRTVLDDLSAAQLAEIERRVAQAGAWAMLVWLIAWYQAMNRRPR